MFDIKYFPGAKKFWHMGKMYDWNTVNVHVMSHALHYGSSVFEGIRAYDTEKGPAVFRLPEHIDRLVHSAEVMNMSVPYSKAEIIDAVKEVMKANKLRSAYIRPNLFYSYGNLGLVPKASPVELTIGCWAWGAYLGEDAKEKGVHVLLLPWPRIHRSQIDLTAKIGGNYVQSNLAGSYARRQGFDEGVFLNLEGRIAEGPGENILIVKDQVVITNDKRESILEGITRTSILEIAKHLGYRVEVRPMTVEDFLNADEAFFTGTAAEVTPITRITDGREMDQPKSEWKQYIIGSGVPGPITKRLAQVYAQVVRGKFPEFEKWLTYIYDSPEDAAAALEESDVYHVTNF